MRDVSRSWGYEAMLLQVSSVLSSELSPSVFSVGLCFKHSCTVTFYHAWLVRRYYTGPQFQTLHARKLFIRGSRHPSGS
jgi:hypothetical protein